MQFYTIHRVTDDDGPVSGGSVGLIMSGRRVAQRERSTKRSSQHCSSSSNLFLNTSDGRWPTDVSKCTSKSQRGEMEDGQSPNLAKIDRRRLLVLAILLWSSFLADCSVFLLHRPVNSVSSYHHNYHPPPPHDRETSSQLSIRRGRKEAP